MNKKVNFRTSSYFSGNIRIIGYVFLLVGLVVVSVNIPVGVFILLTSVTIFTTHYRLDIDFESKKYHDYVWILGLRSGEVKPFETIEYFFVKKIFVRQSMHVRVASTTIRKEQYDAYLKFSEADKLHLMTVDNKKNLITRLRPIAAKLRLRIIDYSEGTPVEL